VGRSLRSKIQPYRQGELDGLCGLYALINGIRLATCDQTSEFDHDVWRNLLEALLSETDLAKAAVEVVARGIDFRALYELAKAAQRHMAANHRVEVTITRGLRAEVQCLDTVLNCLAVLSIQARTAVLMELTGRMRHWTVVAGVGRKSLKLLDSSGVHRAHITSCRLKCEWDHNVGRDYEIHTSRALVIRASPESRRPTRAA
jgi:hypothetical protein